MSVELEEYNHRLVEILFGSGQIMTGKLNKRELHVTEGDYNSSGKTFEVNEGNIQLIRDVTVEKYKDVCEDIERRKGTFKEGNLQEGDYIWVDRYGYPYGDYRQVSWDEIQGMKDVLKGLERERIELEEMIVGKMARELWEKGEKPSGKDQEFWFEAKRRFAEGQREPEIRSMAYSLWEQAGKPAGNDREFWLEAKKRLGFD